ncbi:MAG: 50S ribosomal protein L25/general stress protein Ctc [Pseudomonadales bacterium]
MSDEFVLHAQSRADLGKGASRRLRRNNDLMPAIVYGGKSEPVNISIPHKDILKATSNEAFYSHIIELNIDGTPEDVIIKDLQRHPAKQRLIHADFLRIVKGQIITVNVPLHFINEDVCVGVKMQGGIILHSATDIEVNVLPKDLPEYIEVDMAEVELGQQLHLSDIVLPEGVESVALSHGEEHDLPIAAINAPKGGGDEEDDADAAPSDDAGEDAAADTDGEEEEE